MRNWHCRPPMVQLNLWKIGENRICWTVSKYGFQVLSLKKKFWATPSIRNKIKLETTKVSQSGIEEEEEVKMTQKLHLSFSLQQHKGERKLLYGTLYYEGNGLSVSWHISAFFLLCALFLFCIFIWNATTLKLHQKIAQKCYCCKTINVTFVFNSCCSNFLF